MQNTILTALQQLGASAKSYPDLVKGMIGLGIESYTVDVATGTTLYRLAAGELALREGQALRDIAPAFNNDATIQAVKDSQAGKINYPQFMDAIAQSGVRFYESTLVGTPRVTYIGTGGCYEEEISI